MSTSELAERIAALPASSRTVLERLLDELASRPQVGPIDYVGRARAIREQLFKEYGLFEDSAEEIQRMRNSRE